MNFLNLPEEYTKDATFTLLQVPFEHGPTYGIGASKGPEAIAAASQHLEYYDEQYDVEPYEKGIACPDPLQLPETPDEAIPEIAKHITNTFPVVLGGDHSITQGVVQGLEQFHDEFGVLILDAHADCRHQWHGSTKNHACVTRNIAKNHPVVVIGVRSRDKDEDLTNVQLLHAYDYSKESTKNLVASLPENIYISIDADVFDPSVIRNTGTPEPGGLFWNDVLSILETAFEEKHVIGCDIVEFAPEENYRAEAFTLAKLAYKLMALKCLQYSLQ